ncbi:hypothetical protein CSA17_06070 [bacterium DOLJORAL78_65_58]|nr:MAG: hypothetical protein CSB20_13480 [bacterium DOLZORAL124_64_63]PIE75700.1 MAG: hypothetical protein CSA17_06070 [bacterium DOLJORAL78_65_58]
MAVMALMLLIAGMLTLTGCAPKRLSPLDPGPKDDTVAEGAAPAPQLLAVGLAEGRPTLDVSVDGPAVVLDAGSRARLHTFGEAGGRLQASRAGDAVRWNVGGGWLVHGSIVLQPMDPDQRLSLGEQDFRGDFLIIPSPRVSGLTLVNQVGLEDYLYGVVPWEIGRHGQPEQAALAAQAVAARTYTISHMGSRRALGFDVYASVMDQVYKGSRHEDALCNAAVDATAGLVLMHGDDLVDAYYSACCGGHSSCIDKVWPREAASYLRNRRDSRHGGQAFCADSRYFTWREEWPAGRLEDILQKTLPAYVEYMADAARAPWAHPVFTPRRADGDWRRPGQLLDMKIVARTPSGRVGRLIVQTTAGSYTIKGDRTRWVLAPSSGKPAILRSALFDLKLERSDGRLRRVVARGQGYGHGIGLCQTGALEMSRQGFSAREILTHYYPGSELRHLKLRHPAQGR